MVSFRWLYIYVTITLYLPFVAQINCTRLLIVYQRNLYPMFSPSHLQTISSNRRQVSTLSSAHPEYKSPPTSSQPVVFQPAASPEKSPIARRIGSTFGSVSAVVLLFFSQRALLSTSSLALTLEIAIRYLRF